MSCAAATVRITGPSPGCRLRGRARPRSRALRRWTRASIEADGEPSVTIEDDASERAPDSAEASSSAEDSAGVFVSSGRFNASPKALWRALTEYESLQNASGAIGRCRRMWISSRVGRACLRLQSRDAAYLWGSMRANATVEIQEDPTRGEIRYKVVAGSSAPDISDAATESGSSKPFANEFDVSGTWRLRPVKGASYLCDVELETRIAPRRYPVSVAALRKWTELQLADTVRGVVKRAIEIDQIRLRAPRFLPALETSFGNLGPADRGGGGGGEGAAPPAGQAKEQPLAPSGYLGLSDVPLAAVLGEDAGNGAETSPSAAASSASADERDADLASSRREVRADRWFADGDANLSKPGSSEVHMRRFDSDSAFLRRAIGAVRVEAPPSAVYAILTDYESYPDFLPDLAFLELVRAPRTSRVARAAGTARVRAVAAFARAALYHCLEDAVTFDLTRRDDLLEVRFRVVEAFGGAAEAPGDRITQGKWLVLPCPEAPDATILKFAVEGRAPRRAATRAKGFWQNYASSRYWDASPDDGTPLSERAVFDGVLRLLLSTREHSESVFKAREGADVLENEEANERFFAAARLAPSAASAPSLSRLPKSGPLKRIEAQLRELGYGGDRPSMPRRVELRARGAMALEQEIVDAGGFAAVAAKLGRTKNLRKPRGYWNEIANVEREVRLCIAERRLEPGVMPSRPQLEELGRFDIARALEKHGGAAGIARKIGLEEPRYRARKAKAKR